MKSGNGECYLFAGFRLDCGTQQLTRRGVAIPLTPKAFDTLLILVKDAGTLVPKDELLKRVWTDAIVGDDTLTQNIATLRKALGDSSDDPQFIRTIPRRGYQFIAPVERHLDPLVEQAPAIGAPRRTVWRAWLMWGGGLVVLTATLIALGIGLRLNAPHASPAIRFTIAAPEATAFSPSASLLAVSPDGLSIAFLAARAGGPTRIWVRTLDGLSPRELPGTDDAFSPFWSPDNQQIGFIADGKLKKVSLRGEPPVALCDLGLTGVAGPSWGRDGVILFTQPSGIFRIAADGGAVSRVTTVDQSHGETGHMLPQFLPDGRHFLYVVRSSEGEGRSSWIALRSLDSADDRRLFSASSQALYAEPGYLLFLRDGSLVAQRFDPRRLQVTGEPHPLSDVGAVGANPATPRGMFSVSQTGLIAYLPTTTSDLTWFDRAGKPLGSVGAPGLEQDPAISPDGQYLATSRYDARANSRNIWVRDLVHGGSESRLTSGVWDGGATWSRDASAIAFASGPAAEQVSVFVKNRMTGETRALENAPHGYVADWSRDGRFLIVTSPDTRRPATAPERDLNNVKTQSGREVWLVPVAGDQGPRLIARTHHSWLGATFSPDGRWLAYVNDNGDTPRILVRSPARDVEEPVVVGEGIEPRWREDSRELFFIGTDQNLMAVRVSPGDPLRPTTPVPLFRTNLVVRGVVGVLGRNQYVNTPDGQRFLLRQRHDDAAASIVVLSNWTSALGK